VGTAGAEAEELLDVELEELLDIELLDIEVEELLDVELEELFDIELEDNELQAPLDIKLEELLDAEAVLSPPPHPASSNTQPVATKFHTAIRLRWCSNISLTPERGRKLKVPRDQIVR